MGRLVEAKVIRKGGQLAGASNTGENYFERVAKYVPSEIIAGYVAINGFVLNTSIVSHFKLWVANFLLCLILTPIYLWKLGQPQQPKAMHLTISTIAFAVWAYAVGGDSGIFGKEALNWYEAAIASIILVAFTLISGAFIPKREEP